jgi:hypothetical protein
LGDFLTAKWTNLHHNLLKAGRLKIFCNLATETRGLSSLTPLVGGPNLVKALILPKRASAKGLAARATSGQQNGEVVTRFP